MAAKGNEPAAAFCRAWVDFCHLFDNLYDRDTKVDDEEMGLRFVQFLAEVSGNPFYEQHKAMFYGLMVVAVNSWIDSNRRTGAERHVLAGFYHEIVTYTAYLVGGWKHMRHFSAETREYKPAGIAGKIIKA